MPILASCFLGEKKAIYKGFVCFLQKIAGLKSCILVRNFLSKNSRLSEERKASPFRVEAAPSSEFLLQNIFKN